MVQKEIRKKTRLYGFMAVLLAIVLVALCYSFGAVPGIQPSSQNPGTSSTTSVVSNMKTFLSYDELKSFLANNTNQGSPLVFAGGTLGANPMPVPSAAPSAQNAAEGTPSQYSASTQSYSTTNIQVAGVDEADSVKTDGSYIYVIANQSVYVVNADPKDATVLSKISFVDSSLGGLFLSQDGTKLAVLGSKYEYEYYPYSANGTITSNDTGSTTSNTVPPVASGMPVPSTAPSGMSFLPNYYYVSGNKAFVYAYDVSDKAAPVLTRNFTIEGDYFNSRMIGDYLYTIVSEPTAILNGAVMLPEIYSGDQAVEIPATSIHYADIMDNSYTFTTFIGINLVNDAQEPTNMTIMMGGASDMYVSLSNIYVTYPTSNWQALPMQGTPSPVQSMPMIRLSVENTSIYRISVSEDNLTLAAKGNVPGNVLNQYSMDEYNGYFRLVTNSWTNDGTQQNNLYILDMNLTVVGKLENIATGENLHSALFLGNRGYLVTFQRTDPLFVFDLSQPANPTVLGSLNISGYSDYLYPYDADHIIGVGKEAVAANEGDFAWYQGLKLSLFDVSSVTNPVQLATTIIGDRGTDSPILSDPKAFLFDKSSGLLVIPVNLALINATDNAKQPSSPVPIPTTAGAVGSANQGTLTPVLSPPGASSSGPSSYGTFVWQGVYVYNLSLKDGFVLRGNVTQLQSSVSSQDSSYWMSSNYWINRALFIGNTLYTISDSQIKLNNLGTLAPIAVVDLS